jgi:hypothetical protein
MPLPSSDEVFDAAGAAETGASVEGELSVGVSVGDGVGVGVGSAVGEVEPGEKVPTEPEPVEPLLEPPEDEPPEPEPDPEPPAGSAMLRPIAACAVARVHWSRVPTVIPSALPAVNVAESNATAPTSLDSFVPAELFVVT